MRTSGKPSTSRAAVVSSNEEYDETEQVQVIGNNLVITLPIDGPRPSASGKTLVLATTGGFTRSAAQYKGKPISVSVNATIQP